LVTIEYATASFPSVRTRSSWIASRTIPFIRRSRTIGFWSIRRVILNVHA
jgi:hypothetical protein